MKYASAIIALAGLVSFLAGWSFVRKAPEPAPPGPESVLVIRPVNATVEIPSLKKGDRPGEFRVNLGDNEIQLSREGWPSSSVEVESGTPVVALRLTPPPAKLKAVTSEGDAVTFRLLPSKEQLKTEGSYIRLAPGHYELLAESAGYVPERVPLDLTPGEVKELKLNLKRILFPVPVPVPRPALPAEPYPDPPPPQPKPYSPPRVSYPQPTVPQPRFTPVAPPPLPPQPEPFFTPVP